MERRLAAIVAADVVNYGILIGENETGTLTELKRLQDEVFVPAITRYRGHIVRLMGDGSLLAFDCALNAVNFAVDVQRLMALRKTASPGSVPIDFRMGTNLGDIVHDKNDVHGEGINIAVRLEELAPPGGVCFSHSVYMQTKRGLRDDWLPLGERQLKHVADPVLVWRWLPPEARGAGSAIRAKPAGRGVHGRQILDPKVTSLLVDMHMRSARLALSDAFDAMLTCPYGGRRLTLKDIHGIIGEKLAAAAELLLPISVERSQMRVASGERRRLPQQPMGDYLSSAVDGQDMFFALGLLRRIQAILRSQAAEAHKRAALMRLSRGILKDGQLHKIKESIRFAFVEA